MLMCRGPAELELPHTRFSMTVAEYSAWMDSMVMASSSDAAAAGAQLDRASLVFASPAGHVHTEQAVWIRVRSCLDKFAQRVSAGPAARSAEDVCEEYAWLVRAGPKLIAAFRDTASA